MDWARDNRVKHRELRFCTVNPDADYAYRATPLLADFEGVRWVRPVNGHLLQISYDVTLITLYTIEATLVELGYHLNNSLMCKLKRSLYYYAEETQRANLGLPESADHSVQVFINRYQRLRHGCRDDRPEHWREYR